MSGNMGWVLVGPFASIGDKESHSRLLSAVLRGKITQGRPMKEVMETMEVRMSLQGLYNRYDKAYAKGWQDACDVMKSDTIIATARMSGHFIPLFFYERLANLVEEQLSGVVDVRHIRLPR